MDEAQSFVDQLHSWGYHENLKSKDIDGLYSLSSLRIQAFLHWCATTLTPSHSVSQRFSPEEIEWIETLKQQKQYLTGNTLEEAEKARGIEAAAANELSKKELELLPSHVFQEQDRRTIEKLKAKIQQASLRRDVIARQVRLAQQHARQKRWREDKNQIAEKTNYDIATLNDKLEATLTYLESRRSVSDIMLQKECHVTKKTFMYQQNLDQFNQKHAQLMDQIKIYMNMHSCEMKQGQKTDTNVVPDWFHISGPERWNLTGNDAAVYDAYTVELARLQAVIPLSEADALDAEIHHCMVKAKKRHAELRGSFEQQYQRMDEPSKRTKKDDLQKGIAHARAQIASLMEYSLPDLYHQKAQLESTGILLGDCDGKLKKQQHNLQIQHQIAGILEDQIKVFQTLQNHIESEKNVLDRFQSCIESLRLQMHHFIEHVEAQLSEFADAVTAQENVSNIEHQTFLRTLYESLKTQVGETSACSTAEAIVTLEDVIELVKMKLDMMNELRDVEKEAKLEMLKQINENYSIPAQLKASLYGRARPPPAVEELVIVPTKLSQPLEECRQSYEHVAKSISLIYDDIEQKQKEIAQGGARKAQERALFVDYILRPAKIATMLQKITPKKKRSSMATPPAPNRRTTTTA